MSIFRRERGTPMPAEFHELADYNSRKASGIVHTAEYVQRMTALQARYSEWQDQDLRERGWHQREDAPGAWYREG